MQSHMSFKQGLMGEFFLADVAFIGFLPSVEPHMHIQGALLGKTLVTDAALVSSDTSVCHHVFD